MMESFYNLATMLLVIVNLGVIIGFFWKIESRLTVVETQQKLMLNGLIKTHQIERREHS